MPINFWPKNERPREKLIQSGANSLSNSELLAIVLHSGHKNKSAVTLAQELLTTYGGLHKLTRTNYRDLIKTAGIGPAKYAQLHAGLELYKRTLEAGLTHEIILTNSTHAKQFIHAKLRDYPNEIFAGLFLDTQHRMIAFEVLSSGSLNYTAVHPRDIIKRILHHNAAALIIAHNHPSGVAEPSDNDIQVTHSLQEALQLFEIPLLDHFIVGETEVLSFQEHNLLKVCND